MATLFAWRLTQEPPCHSLVTKNVQAGNPLVELQAIICAVEDIYRGGLSVEHGGLPVIAGKGSSLFGCDWISVLQLNLRPVLLVEAFTSLQQVLDKHCDVFKEGLGKLRDAKAKIFISLHECPHFFPAHPVTFVLHQRVEEKLEHLQAMVVIHPVQFSD